MTTIKLKIKTKTEDYPIIIGSNLVKSLNSYLLLRQEINLIWIT